MLNVDLSKKPIDEPWTEEEIKSWTGVQGMRDRVFRVLGKRNPTTRDFMEISHRGTFRDHPRFVGSPKDVADGMEEWFSTRACDGYVVAASHVPGGYEEFVRLRRPRTATPRGTSQRLSRHHIAREPWSRAPAHRRVARGSPLNRREKTMKLMYSPGACSIGIHVLLEEIGKPYEAQLVNLREGGAVQAGLHRGQSEIEGADAGARRRLGADRVSGHRLLAGAHQSGQEAAAGRCRSTGARAGGVGLLRQPRSTCRASRACSARPTITPNPADEDKVKERGKEMVEKGFAVMDKALAGKDYLAGAILDRRLRRCSTSSSGARSA